MPSANQNISQNIGSSSGSIQNTIAGRDASSTQKVTSVSGIEITIQDVRKSLEDIENTIRSLGLEEEPLNSALEDLQAAKKEAKKESFHKGKILGNLSSALCSVKGILDVTGRTSELMDKIAEPVAKLSEWLGISFSDLFN
jgi:hypothetical protein